MLGRETLCKAGPSNNGPSLPETALDADDPNAWLKGMRGDWKSRIVVMLPVRWPAPDQPMVEDGCGISRKGDEHKLGACCQRHSAAIRFLPAPAGIVLPAIECAGSLVEAGELVKDA